MFHVVYIVCLRNCDICWCYFTRSGIFFIADLLGIDSVVEINKNNTIVLFIIPPLDESLGYIGILISVRSSHFWFPDNY